MKCPECKRKFPKYLINEVFMEEHLTNCCPLCYADYFKEIRGVNWYPASTLLVKYLQTARQLYPQWASGERPRKYGQRYEDTFFS